MASTERVITCSKVTIKHSMNLMNVNNEDIKVISSYVVLVLLAKAFLEPCQASLTELFSENNCFCKKVPSLFDRVLNTSTFTTVTQYFNLLTCKFIFNFRGATASCDPAKKCRFKVNKKTSRTTLKILIQPLFTNICLQGK